MRARLARALRSTDTGLLVMALAVGACTGLGAVGSRYLVTGLTRVATESADHSALPALGPCFVPLTPVVARRPRSACSGGWRSCTGIKEAM